MPELQTRRPVVCLDFDGTVVDFAWPAWGDWLPGAREAIRDLHDAGAHIVVASARLNPYSFYDFWTTRSRRPLYQVVQDEHRMREFFDAAGLEFVEIYNDQGKCPADLYVDDHGLWYPGRPGSWKKLTPIIKTKVGLIG